MSFDPFNISPDKGTMTRAEVIGHAAANLVQQLTWNKDGTERMPRPEVARLLLVAFIGSYKAFGLGAQHVAVKDLRERWDEVIPDVRDANSVIEID